jgi:uncharacterized protein YkwD
VRGSFLQFFDANGGLGMFGYPISDPVNENGRTVQYFERQRFEYHSEAEGTSHVVQLSRLGAELAPESARSQLTKSFASQANNLYFKESGHSLRGPFLDYWRAHGGVRVLGFPITEQYSENGLLVQYFERARMEYHPEIGSGARGVQLGLLGRQYVAAHPDVASRLSSNRTTSPVSRGTQPAPQPAQATGSPLTAGETTLLNLINDTRRGQGIGPVVLNGTLRDIALSRSRDMVAKGYFSHTAPDGSTYFTMLKNINVGYKFAGEIIANNNYPSDQAATQAFTGFANSPHHHDIMLDARYTQAGVGEAIDGRGYHYYTVVFLEP